MSGPGCATKVENSLKDVGSVNIDVEAGRVTVISELPWVEIQEKIEKSGRRAVLCGFGGKFFDKVQGISITVNTLFRILTEKSAVAIVKDGVDKIKGVVRFSAANEDTPAIGCVVDGVIDGLKPGFHGIHIHETGDITNGCESLGKHYNPRNSPHGGPHDDENRRHAGDLGNIEANSKGRATFRFNDKIISVYDIIGRSIVVTENADDYGRGKSPDSLVDGSSGTRLACGIIARSAGIFQNFKKICACDGVTLWDERDKPVAGSNRSNL